MRKCADSMMSPMSSEARKLSTSTYRKIVTSSMFYKGQRSHLRKWDLCFRFLNMSIKVPISKRRHKALFRKKDIKLFLILHDNWYEIYLNLRVK